MRSDAAPWPLAGVRVLDLSREIAGPYATKLLCDAGADVIKLEPPEGDPLRRWTASGLELPPGSDGALFQFLNASKRSAVADLDAADGRELVCALAGTADLVVEDLGPGELERRGLGPDALRALHPSLCGVSISPFGQTGPWAHRPATEWTLQAALGIIARRGLPERGPVGIGGRLGEWAAGGFAAVGALAALRSARQTGRGLHLDLSIFEAMLLCMTVYHDLNCQFLGGELVQYVDTPSIEPTRDGWVGFATVTSQQWQDFCGLIGHPELARDDRYLTADRRMRDLERIRGLIHAFTRERTVDEIIEVASALRIPVSPIGNGRTLPKTDHFRARGVFLRNPAGFLQPRTPFRLEKTPLRPPGRAPRLGEHAEELRAEVGRARAAPTHPAPAGSRDAAAAPAGARDALHAAAPPRARPVAPTAPGGPALPFAGLRVVDLTAFWAGPFATWLLAALGADVVKVESIQRPDGMRFVNAKPTDALWECGSIYHGANPGKRGVTLRLDAPEGRELLLRLVEGADVLIENYSVRVMEHFDLDWPVLRARNPRLVMVRIPAWGLDGPWRDRVGFAMNVEQASGLAWLSGYPDLPMVVNSCDPVGGCHAVFALALALEERRRTQQGQLVEMPLVEPALNFAAAQLIEHSAYGVLLERSGNRGPAAAPQGVYACAGPGEWLALAVASDEQWRGLRRALGDPAWARDPSLGSASGRRAAHDLLDAKLGAWCRARPRDAAVERLLAEGVPAHALINGHHVMPNPQLEHRRFFQWLEHPHTGRSRYPGLPFRCDALGPEWHRRPPPTLGQHNDGVLGGELGLSREELAELRAKGIAGERPAWL
jgi:crotonobetainyl-CoA:carnitine CoA-transferase CaiB-like acyl-CoA transferase